MVDQKLIVKIELTGQRRGPIAEGFRPAVRKIGETEFHSVVVSGLEGEIQGTETAEMNLIVLAPETWTPTAIGDKFELTEGPKVIGKGQIVGVA